MHVVCRQTAHQTRKQSATVHDKHLVPNRTLPGCVAAGVGRADAARGRKLFLRSFVRLALLLPDESGGLLAAALLPVVAM